MKELMTWCISSWVAHYSTTGMLYPFFLTNLQVRYFWEKWSVIHALCCRRDTSATVNGSGSTVLLAWTAPSDTSTTINSVTGNSAGKKETLSVGADHQSSLSVTRHDTRQPRSQGHWHVFCLFCSLYTHTCTSHSLWLRTIGSVATCLRCGGIFNGHFVNLLLSVLVNNYI